MDINTINHKLATEFMGWEFRHWSTAIWLPARPMYICGKMEINVVDWNPMEKIQDAVIILDKLMESYKVKLAMLITANCTVYGQLSEAPIVVGIGNNIMEAICKTAIQIINLR